MLATTFLANGRLGSEVNKFPAVMGREGDDLCHFGKRENSKVSPRARSLSLPCQNSLSLPRKTRFHVLACRDKNLASICPANPGERCVDQSPAVCFKCQLSEL